MTVEEVINEIKQLSPEDRLRVFELITHTLREEPRQDMNSGSSLSRVRGLLRPDGPMPTDADLSNAYARHLSEKYT
jgi:hypothetical protein